MSTLLLSALSSAIFSKRKQFLEVKRRDYHFQIDVENGSLFFDRKLITFKGARLPIDLHLKYVQPHYANSINNLSAYTGFPKGFKLNYHVFVTIDGNQFKYEDKDGFVHTFAKAINSSTLYCDNSGTGLILTIESPGYKISNEKGDYQLFDSSGRLIIIHEEIADNYYREINITYEQSNQFNLKIIQITDSFNHTINIDYLANSINIKNGNALAFLIRFDSSYNLEYLDKMTSTQDYNRDVFYWWTSVGIYGLSFCSREYITFEYTNSKIEKFETNYRQNTYFFSYDDVNKETAVTNARMVTTVYQYGHNQTSAQVSDNGTPLDYFTLSNDASSYTVKKNAPYGQNKVLNLSMNGNVPVNENVSFVSNQTVATPNTSLNSLKAKRNYILVAEISGDLGNGSFEIVAKDSLNNYVGRMIFKDKQSSAVVPISFKGSFSIANYCNLTVTNNTPNSITIKKVRIIPLLGDFNVICTNNDNDSGAFHFATDSYYYLAEGQSFTFKQNNTSISVSGVHRVTRNDYIANEELFYTRTGTTFRFWCNDKTLLVDNLTDAEIIISSSKKIVFSTSNNQIMFVDGQSVSTMEFYRLEGSQDHSLNITKVTHDSNVISNPPSGVSYPVGTNYLETEKRIVCENETMYYYCYDKYNRLLSSFRNGFYNVNNYDSRGNLSSEVKVSLPLSRVMLKTYSYNNDDSLYSEQSLVGTTHQTTTYHYDSDGSLEYKALPNSLTIYYEYQPITKDKIIDVTFYTTSNYFTQSISYEDDNPNTMESSNQSYEFWFNGAGELYRVYHNDDLILTNLYYSHVYGEETVFDVLYTTYQNGFTSIKSYDQFERLLSNDDLTYSYDNYSNVASILDITVSHLFQHDYYNSIKNCYNSNCNLIVSYEYDDFSRLINQEFEQHGNTVYSIDYSYYQTADLEKNIKISAINCDQDSIIVDDESDDFKRLTSRQVTLDSSANGFRHLFSYCQDSSETNFMVSEVKYQNVTNGVPNTSVYEKDNYYYDASGNIVGIVRSKTNTQSTIITTYEYDLFGRIIRENNQLLNRTYVYSYDNKGNILCKIEFYFTLGTLSNPLSIRSYTYNSYVPDRLNYINSESFSYDNVGNPIIYRGHITTWCRGILLASYEITSDEVVDFGYDGFKNRVCKTIRNSSYQVLKSITYEYVNGILFKECRPNNHDLTFLYSHDGVTGFIHQGHIYFYEKNMQQDIIALRDEDNDIAARYAYDAWGNHKVFTPTGNEDTNPNSVGNLNPFRYRSYYYDIDLKMYWLSFRYYDSYVGRFISPDDYSYLDYTKIHGLNLYAYSKNNPVMLYDPSGHVWLIIAAIVVSALISVAVTVAVGHYQYEKMAEASDKNMVPNEDSGFMEEEPFVGDGFTIYYSIKENAVNGKYSELSVFESWRYSEKEITSFLLHLKKKHPEINVGRMKNEWVWHNVAYALGIGTESSKSVDVCFDASDSRFWYGLFFDIFRIWG